VAQTVHLQNQQILKNAISKNPLAPNLVNVEIHSDRTTVPAGGYRSPSFEEAAKEAFCEEAGIARKKALNLLNGEIDLKANAQRAATDGHPLRAIRHSWTRGKSTHTWDTCNDSGIAIDRFERQSRKRFHSLDDTARLPVYLRPALATP